MLKLDVITAISDIPKAQWNALFEDDQRMPYPFTRHQFLTALESSGSVGEKTGWYPHHLLFYQDGQLCAAMPSYLKSDSFGEYVFDWGWADAYQRYGLQYYPKLVSAIPYTPVTGPRIGVASGVDLHSLWGAIQACIQQYCADNELSSWHLLFPEKTLADSWNKPILTRTAVHFQWQNQGFDQFSDFLDTFSSRKRKNLRKERDKIFRQGIEFERLDGRQIDSDTWGVFYRFYQLTYAKRSGHGGYLSRAFFEQLSQSMPEQLVLVLAKKDGVPIAGALNFRDQQGLYGRYWGCQVDVEFLHFETCYYQGIEYCIEHGLKKFDPGVQGEHKIQRGFRPTYTYSNHWLAEPGFQSAVEDFLVRESSHIESYYEDAESLLPFKAES